jgi:hypothetical protein
VALGVPKFWAKTTFFDVIFLILGILPLSRFEGFKGFVLALLAEMGNTELRIGEGVTEVLYIDLVGTAIHTTVTSTAPTV